MWTNLWIDKQEVLGNSRHPLPTIGLDSYIGEQRIWRNCTIAQYGANRVLP